MASRKDDDVILLTLVSNEIARRGDTGSLPPDLRGDAIPNQVHEHEQAVAARWDARRGAKGEQEMAKQVYAETASLLTTLRHALLTAYPRPGDARLAPFEPLGATRSPAENCGRLVSLGPLVATAVEAGELTLPPQLSPEAIVAQAERHARVAKTKAGKVARKQAQCESLATERRQTRLMLRRLRAFVKAFYGDDQLASFGFSLPLPPRRPRLEADPADAGPTDAPAAA
jgi:hypothetical protein